MTWTAPFTAVSGAIITAAGWNTSGRDNLLHLRNLLPDASGASLPLVSSGTTSAAFGQLPTAGLADAAVTTAKIADVNVTTGKLADLAVTSPKIASDAVNTGNIVNAAVTYAKAGSDLFKQGKAAGFSGTQALTSSYADVSGVSISCDRDGQWLVIAVAEFSVVSTDAICMIKTVAGGVDLEEGFGAGSINLNASGTTAMDLLTVSGTTTVKVQARKDSGSGGSSINYCKLVAIWLAP